MLLEKEKYHGRSNWHNVKHLCTRKKYDFHLTDINRENSGLGITEIDIIMFGYFFNIPPEIKSFSVFI